MTTDTRVKTFITLGNFLKQFSENGKKDIHNSLNAMFCEPFEELIKTVHLFNPWFVETNVRKAVAAIADNLTEESLVDWLSAYITRLRENNSPRNVAVIMAGNVPLVGFMDMLCVIMSGNKFIGKLSSKDDALLTYISKILIAIEPKLADFISFTDGKLEKMDAVITTGSNNTSRYFEYYFAKYPHIIRKNRTSVTVLTGAETTEELSLLGNDVFLYFGLGCRNVSKLFVPKGYIFDLFYESVFRFRDIINHNKYANNYEYNRTIYLMKNEATLLDNNFLLLKADTSYHSPIGVLFYEVYEDIATLAQRLEQDKDQLQCLVSGSKEIKNAVPFGASQCPALGDYADGVDTMEFLINAMNCELLK